MLRRNLPPNKAVPAGGIQAFLQFAYSVDLMPDQGLDRTQKWLEVGQKIERLSKTAIS